MIKSSQFLFILLVTPLLSFAQVPAELDGQAPNVPNEDPVSESFFPGDSFRS